MISLMIAYGRRTKKKKANHKMVFINIWFLIKSTTLRIKPKKAAMSSNKSSRNFNPGVSKVTSSFNELSFPKRSFFHELRGPFIVVKALFLLRAP
jgi:hypothetical protein